MTYRDSPPASTPWLLLDERVPGAWGLSAGIEPVFLGLVVTSAGIHRISAESPIPDEDPKLLVLLLSHQRKFQFTEMPGLERIFNKSSVWNVWCHYGGDIALAGKYGYAYRWEKWCGLCDSCKATVWEANLRKPPLPFSHTLGMHPQLFFPFDDLRARIRAILKQGNAVAAEKLWPSICEKLSAARLEVIAGSRRAEITELSRAISCVGMKANQIQQEMVNMRNAGHSTTDVAQMLVGIDGRSGILGALEFAAVNRLRDTALSLVECGEMIDCVDKLKDTVQKLRESVGNGAAEGVAFLRFETMMDRLTELCRKLSEKI